jgi:hypothetical protein
MLHCFAGRLTLTAIALQPAWRPVLAQSAPLEGITLTVDTAAAGAPRPPRGILLNLACGGFGTPRSKTAGR